MGSLHASQRAETHRRTSTSCRVLITRYATGERIRTACIWIAAFIAAILITSVLVGLMEQVADNTELDMVEHHLSRNVASSAGGRSSSLTTTDRSIASMLMRCDCIQIANGTTLN